MTNESQQLHIAGICFIFNILFQAYVMYEKSMLDFQSERMRFKQLSMELDQRWES